MPNVTLLLPGIVGAYPEPFVHGYRGQARMGARAVYFEIDMNRVSVQVAREYGSYTPLSRTSFERLLPELATWLRPDQLQTISTTEPCSNGLSRL